jgi:hypothetical protein
MGRGGTEEGVGADGDFGINNRGGMDAVFSATFYAKVPAKYQTKTGGERGASKRPKDRVPQEVNTVTER